MSPLSLKIILQIHENNKQIFFSGYNLEVQIPNAVHPGGRRPHSHRLHHRAGVGGRLQVGRGPGHHARVHQWILDWCVWHVESLHIRPDFPVRA